MICKICRNISRGNLPCPLLGAFSRSIHRTHYDTLKLARNCTSKQIKDAFIKLSKQHHPDVSKSKQSHSEFLQINEAYKVLGKPDSRRHYDLSLALRYRRPSHNPNFEDRYGDRPHRDPFHDPSFWVNRDKQRDEFYRRQPYYGINGLDRQSNGLVLLFCILTCILGISLQVMAINKSFTFQRQELLRRSIEMQNTLNETQQTARDNGNDKQMELLKTRLLGDKSRDIDE